ncbi:MAG: NYN domain-containing protein, partial [Nanoarchaeota archaeon]
SNFYHLAKLNYNISKVDFEKLANKFIDSDSEELVKINYFIAPVNQQEKPELYSKQQKFFEQIKKNSLIEIHLGKLVRRPLNKINILCRDCGIQEADSLSCPKCGNEIKLSETYKSTEKGVDVNLAINLLLDALNNEYGVALFFSGDADFCPAIKYIVNKLKKEIIFCAFPKPKTNELMQCCSETRKITKKFLEESGVN